MVIYVATKNAGKVGELRELLAGPGRTVATFADYADVAEGATSYGDNAALKARALRAQLVRRGIAALVIGDDSGLEVAALGGRPGVLSARYGPPGADWAGRRAALLAELAASPGGDRSARFVCALHAIEADGAEIAVEAAADGSIALEPRGVLGFSYDPLFVDAASGRTYAELDARKKDRVSHRGLAVRALLARLGDDAGARGRRSDGKDNGATGT